MLTLNRPRELLVLGTILVITDVMDKSIAKPNKILELINDRSKDYQLKNNQLSNLLVVLMKDGLIAKTKNSDGSGYIVINEKVLELLKLYVDDRFVKGFTYPNFTDKDFQFILWAFKHGLRANVLIGLEKGYVSSIDNAMNYVYWLSTKKAKRKTKKDAPNGVAFIKFLNGYYNKIFEDFYRRKKL